MNVKKLKATELTNTLELGRSDSSKQTKIPKPVQKPSTDTADIPVEKSIKESERTFSVSNKWPDNLKRSNRISRIIYNKKEQLGDLNTIYNIGGDVIRIEHNNIQYVLRKATLDVARAIVNIYSKIKKHVEEIAGYLVTLSGAVYIITRTNVAFFSFNSELSSGVSRYQNPRFLDNEEKLSIFEKTIERLIELGKKNLLIKDFSLKNIIYSGKLVLLGDLRNLRMSVNPKMLISSVRSFLKQLLSLGLITKEEAVYLITYYMGGNMELCLSWFESEYSKPAEDIEVLEALEMHII